MRVLCLTRNFGKEIALTAGLHEARGAAVIMIDGDGQHPVEAIPEFVVAWQQGALVVVGRRTKRRGGLTKRAGSKLFYGLFNRVLGLHADPDSSDFRLIDRSVCDQFKELSEHKNRMTRSLIDWFGYDRVTISYSEHTRVAGSSPYTLGKLMKLAVDGAISHSTSPLYIAAYAGAGIMAFASLVGVVMTGNYFLNDPIGLHATASAYGLVLVLFLIGLLLISQGIIGLYLSHIPWKRKSATLRCGQKEIAAVESAQRRTPQEPYRPLPYCRRFGVCAGARDYCGRAATGGHSRAGGDAFVPRGACCIVYAPKTLHFWRHTYAP